MRVVARLGERRRVRGFLKLRNRAFAGRQKVLGTPQVWRRVICQWYRAIIARGRRLAAAPLGDYFMLRRAMELHRHYYLPTRRLQLPRRRLAPARPEAIALSFRDCARASPARVHRREEGGGTASRVESLIERLASLLAFSVWAAQPPPRRRPGWQQHGTPPFLARVWRIHRRLHQHHLRRARIRRSTKRSRRRL